MMNFEYILVFVLVLATASVGYFSDCAEYLVSGHPRVPDNKLTASSNEHEARNARLTSKNTNGWCPLSTVEKPYIQVEFNALSRVMGFVFESEHVRQYTVQHSSDGNTWEQVDELKMKQTFIGNSDPHILKTNIFQEPLPMESIRIYLKQPGCLRFDILGCKNYRNDSRNCFEYLISGAEGISDSQLSSSYSKHFDVKLKNIKLNSTARGWCERIHSYIQVNFNQVVTVTGIVTQGVYKNSYKWIRSYTVKYRYNDQEYKDILNEVRETKIFYNYYYNKPTLEKLENPLQMKFLRLYPTIWTLWPSRCIKFDVLGCSINNYSECNSFLVSSVDDVPDYKLKSSSQYNEYHSPQYARLNSTENGNWCPAKEDIRNSYIQVELNTLSEVVGIATQGTWDGDWWVKEYYIQHSKDGHHWDLLEHPDDPKLGFLGNFDRSTIIINALGNVKAKFIRILPQSWNFHPCLRFDVLGCYVSPKEDWSLEVKMTDSNKTSRLFIGIEGNVGYTSVTSTVYDHLSTTIHSAIGEPYMITIRNLEQSIHMKLDQVVLKQGAATSSMRYKFVCNCLLTSETRTVHVSKQEPFVIGVKTGDSSYMGTMGNITITIGDNNSKHRLDGIFTNRTYDTFPVMTIPDNPKDITIEHDSIYWDYWFLEYISIFNGSSEWKFFCNCWFLPYDKKDINIGNAEKQPEPMPWHFETIELATTVSATRSDTTILVTTAPGTPIYETTTASVNTEVGSDTTTSETEASDTPVYDTTTTSVNTEVGSDTTITTAEENDSSTYDASTSGNSSHITLDATTITEKPRKCFCPKWACPKNVTTENIADLTVKVIQELKTPKNKTSRYIRSKTSASDNRPSSQAIGYIGGIIIMCVVGGIIIVDLSNVRRHLQILKLRRKTKPT